MRRNNFIKGILFGVLFSISIGRIAASPPTDSIPPLTEENLKLELAKQEIPHADIVFNQAMLETGHFKSQLCRKYHNLFGIRHGKPYAHYNNWLESVADYKKRISSRYKGGAYYAFLERIHYAVPKVYVKHLKRMKK